MQTEKNDLFKIVIIAVITALVLIPIVYFVMKAQTGIDTNSPQINVPQKEKEQIIHDPAFNVNNYKVNDNTSVKIEFCENSDFMKKLNASLVLERQETEDLILKIVPNHNWTKEEIDQEMSTNVCGISDQFIGFIGNNSEYLLFASPCPAAGDANTDFIGCQKRLAEIEKYFK